MKYTVEKFFVNVTKAAVKATVNGAGLADNVADAVVKNVDLADGATALKNIPTPQVKRITNVGGDAGGAVGKGANDAGGAVDNIVKNGATLTDEAGDAAKLTDEVTGLVTKNADEMADKLTDASKTNQKLSSKINKLLKDNPGKTLAAVLIIAGTATGLALATEGFNKSNNQPLTIINSYPTEGGDEGDVTIEYIAASGVTVVDGDNVVVNPHNDQENLSSSGQVSIYFIPSTIYGQTIQVKTIVSSSSIIINYPGSVGYAKKGVLTLQTTMENRMLNEADKVGDAAKDLTGTILGPILGPIQEMIGPYIKYAQGCCCCICCLILLSIIYKVSKMAN